MIDTLKLMLNDYEISDSSEIRLQLIHTLRFPLTDEPRPATRPRRIRTERCYRAPTVATAGAAPAGVLR